MCIFFMRDEVKHCKKVVTQEYIDGGLKMVDIENFDASMKISWVKKMLKTTDPPKWLKILGETIDIDKIIKLGPNYALLQTKPLPNNFGKMYLNPGKNFVHVLVIIMLPQTPVKIYCGITKIYKLTKKHFF